ncbi:adhesion G protein-coupled receptor A1 isoform X2 [Phycodurus eques]|uniref:adhesion G protein-coupled receptor A1 isoform X2 n=1 Tax=Phycodurus eques TaxID=693459 RepID=UPI002ACD82F3|nr:adhesion G protein-coupled receptor A1 isoform X2 [Phycodurus eques]
MDLKRVLSFPPYPGDYLHPVVYACTAVMLLCLLVSIMTYIVHYSVIRISRNGWHTLLNFLFHTGLTFGVFAGGINQINVPFLCRIVGIILQYASLSTMFWLTFTARNICNNVSKDPLKAPGSNSPVLAESKTTILRFYIVSNGIPLIIVGITAAFGMENYGSRDDALYCWMAWEPSLGGFYAPHCAKRDDVWHHWWACCTAKSKTDDGDGNRQSHRQELHQPRCHLNSICSGKELLLSPQVVQSLTYKNASPSQNLSPSHVTSCCVAETVTTPVSPLSESAPSPRSLALSDELPRTSLPLPSCRFDRTKSCSFNHPRPCLRDYRSHMASNSTDGSVNSSQLEVPHAAHYLESSPVSNSPHPDLQISCSSPHLDQQRGSCHVQPSCHNIHNSLTFSHSLILPSHRVNTCQWNLYSSADHFSTTSCPEKPDACNLLYPQELDTSSYMSEIPEKDKETRCAEMEPKLFPRNTLPRQHATINRRVTFGRNRSLQEDSLFVSDTTGNIRTGPWKNETTV